MDVSPPLFVRSLTRALLLSCLAGLICLLPCAKALAVDAQARLADKQPVASIRQTSYTVPALHSSLQLPGDATSLSYAHAVFPISPKSALPAAENGQLAPEPPRRKPKSGKELKTLPADTSAAAPKLAGYKSLSKEVFFAPPPYLQQLWESALERHDPEKAFGRHQRLMNPYRKEQWNNIVASWNSMTPDKKLRVINGFFNNWPSKSDQENYGQKEYWASPEEMLRKGSGDCEDYAIIKYLALRYLSWPSQDIWLVLVQDRKKKTHHAVLAARYGQQTFILDNLSKPRYLIIPEEAYMKNYMPFYAINEESSWIFAMPRQKLPPAADEEKGFVGVAESDAVMKR